MIHPFNANPSKHGDTRAVLAVGLSRTVRTCIKYIVCQHSLTDKTAQRIDFYWSVPNTACYIPNGSTILPANELLPFALK